MPGHVPSDSEIRDALRACFISAPASLGSRVGTINIVDLGLIRDMDLEPALDAPGAGIPGVPPRFLLHLTLLPLESEEACQHLRELVLNRLFGLPEIFRCEVTFASEARWTPGEVTPQGRRLLGLNDPHFPILRG